MTPARHARLTHVLNHRQPNLTLVLENVFDPHNISAVMRTADAVGIQEIFVVNTRMPAHKKWGSKSSSSAAKWLTIHQFDHLETCMAAVRKSYQIVYTTHLAQNSVSVYDLNLTQSVALVFGNEHSGCSSEIVALSDGNFIIPQVGIIQSLNISVACAVTIYEAYRQKTLAGHYNSPALAPTAYAELMAQWSNGAIVGETDWTNDTPT
ncbi:MAG: RNA methyltransferase [Bacteroidetes bacterium]|nr:MAG: RNA methyltransferase [Bacteroidota bacterium]